MRRSGHKFGPLPPALLLAFTSIARISLAADYYVDASLGNDAWSGTHPEPQPTGCAAASCTDGPWQGLSPVTQGGFLAGDNIFLHCGQTWRDALNAVDSGTTNSPISFSSYGPNCAISLPTVSGSDLVQNWIPDTSQPNVYVADLATPVFQLFVDGQYLNPAQHPNTGYSLIDADSGTELLPGCINLNVPGNGSCFLEDADLSALNDLIGAGVRIRTRLWKIEERTIIGFDQAASKLFWDLESRFPANKKYGYYLYNKRWMLDAPGEWYHDTVAGKLYVWLPGSSDPGQHIIEASVREDLFEAKNVSNINLSNIAFVHSSEDGVNLNSASNFLIDSITISDSGRHGVRIVNNSLGTLQNSVVQRSEREGIEVRISPGTSIIGNQIIDSGTVGAPKNSFAAINGNQSDGLTIIDNEITNTGYIGIRYKRNTIIRNNILRNTCLVLDDCGATYSYEGSNPGPPYNSLIDSNIIVDVIGNDEGWPTDATLAIGIYLDRRSSGVTVTDNVVVNADHGIYFNSSDNHLVANNVLFGNRKHEVTMAERVTAGELSANRFENNLLFPLAYRETVFLTSYFDTTFASFSNNQYALVHKDTLVYESYTPTGFGTTITRFDFPAWQNQREPDAQAIAPFAIAAGLLDPGRPDMIGNSTFSSGASGWSRSPSNSDLDWQAMCGWEGGCVSYRASTDPVNSLLVSNPISLVEGQAYVVEFAVRGEFDNQTVNIIVGRNEPGNYENVGLYAPVTIGTDWSHHRLVFNATHTLSTAALEFNPLAGEAIDLDDVHVKGAIANDPIDDAHILINDVSSAQAMPCPDEGGPQTSRCGDYVDEDGAPVVWPLTVGGRSAKIIVWAANPFLDSDFDTLADVDDNCVTTSNSPQKNTDNDIAGNACDAFPSDAAEWLDTDGDGTGNNADPDDDNDGLLDTEEIALGSDPLVSDSDGDGANDGIEVSAETDPLEETSFPILADGDVNGDGQVNVADLLVGLRVLTGQTSASPFELGRLDVAPLSGGMPLPDGQFDLGDYVVLQRKVLGEINF